MKHAEVKLIDGFILNKGFAPFFYTKGSVFSTKNEQGSIDKIYVISPDYIKHELYGALLNGIGIEESGQENLCTNSDCFATHTRHHSEYNPRAGLCEKHAKTIESLKGKVKISIANTLLCHSLREERLKNEMGAYEKEFGEQCGVEIESISFRRDARKIKDGEWLFVYKDRDEILGEYDKNADDAVEVYKLISIRPCMNLDEFNNELTLLGKFEYRGIEVLEPFDAATELKLEDLTKLFPEMTFEEIVCGLEAHEHGSRLTYDEDAKVWRAKSGLKEYIKFWTEFQKDPEKKMKEMREQMRRSIESKISSETRK